jgi:hypothetical protein
MPEPANEPPFDSEMRAALLDALDDLWANIGPTEVRQLQPETVDLCQFVHEVRDHGAHWTDWRHRR